MGELRSTYKISERNLKGRGFLESPGVHVDNTHIIMDRRKIGQKAVD
jgi:hypothetical protein